MLSFIIFVLIWVYGIHILSKAKTNAFLFLWGSVGFFLMSMIYFREPVTVIINYFITAISGVFGNLSGMYEVVYMHSVIYIRSIVNGVFLQIDSECSGAIEIFCYLAILWFYNIYNKRQKIIYSIYGIIYIILANVYRIFLICTLVYIFGYDVYHFAHTYLGRFMFYSLSVLLYFYIFTRPQIESMKVGNFKYTN